MFRFYQMRKFIMQGNCVLYFFFEIYNPKSSKWLFRKYIAGSSFALLLFWNTTYFQANPLDQMEVIQNKLILNIREHIKRYYKGKNKF